jgi:transcriptional regulator with XRE-family HTH domain
LRPDLDVIEISRRLRGARELAGLSIEDLAATTKIRRTALQAIERGEFDQLPGDFYTRAFLKAYAREVHLSPDEIVHDYDAGRTLAQPQPAIAVAATAGHEPAKSPRQRAPDNLSVPAAWSIPAWLTSQSARSAGAVAVVVLLLMMTVFRSRTAENRSPEAGAVGTSGVVEAPPAPPVATPRAEAAPDKLILEIHPAGPTWVTGAADGKRVIYRLLAPGEHVTVQARDDLTFRVGNAVAFAYAINGMPGKPLGGPDEVREFQITRENYRTFGR